MKIHLTYREDELAP